MSSRRPFLRVGAAQFPPWFVYHYDQQNVLHLGGVLGNILKILAATIKFDYKIVPPPEKLYGNHANNGTWTRLIQSIQHGETEFAMPVLNMTPERENVIDFTIPVVHSNVGILTPRPKVEYDFQGVFKPFSLEVWLCTLISLVVVNTTIILTEKVESKLYGYEIYDLTARSLMWSTKALTQEGSQWLPRAVVGRMVVTIWLLASLIFMSCFSGILTAMLTVPKLSIPVDSLEDLVSQNKIPWKMISGAFEEEFFQQSESIVHQKAFAGMTGSISSLWKEKDELLRGAGAVIDDEITFKVLMDWDYSTNGRCNFYLARKPIFSNTLIAIPFKTDSIYLEKTNSILNSLKESGILDYWVNQYLGNATHCLKSPSNDRAAGTIQALNIEAFWGSFMLLLIGFFIASTAFLIEILCESRSVC